VIGCLECGVDPFSPRVLQDRLGDDIVRIVRRGRCIGRYQRTLARPSDG
jgi:hypothetical protein